MPPSPTAFPTRRTRPAPWLLDQVMAPSSKHTPQGCLTSPDLSTQSSNWPVPATAPSLLCWPLSFQVPAYPKIWTPILAAAMLSCTHLHFICFYVLSLLYMFATPGSFQLRPWPQTGLSKWPSWKSNDETKFWVPQTKSNKQMMAISWISFSHTDRTPPINYWVFVSSITKGCFTKMKAWLEWQVNWISSRWNSICCSIFVE